MAEPSPNSLRDRLASPVLLAVLVTFALMSVGTLRLLKLQVAGVDFAGLWAGGRAAITDVGRLYDFHYVSQLQNWPLGFGRLRPFVYPPSTLPLLVPFGLLPWPLGYGIWTGLTGAFYAWAGWRAGAPRWFVLIPFVAFAAFCGQATFLLGGLVLTALMMLDERREIAAGVLFGLAAAIKPQLLILLPVALVADQRWRTVASTALTGLALGVLSAAIWGLTPWLQWFAALKRFEYLVSHSKGLVDNAITPYAALLHFHQPAAFAYLLAPAALAWVWFTFRRGEDRWDRLIALFSGAFLISPYAMNYEIALFAPATAAYLARRRDRVWVGYVCAAIAQSLVLPLGQTIVLRPAFFALAATALLPLLKALGNSRPDTTAPAPGLPTAPETSLIPNP